VPAPARISQRDRKLPERQQQRELKSPDRV
jgi:hypothetical protein